MLTQIYIYIYICVCVCVCVYVVAYSYNLKALNFLSIILLRTYFSICIRTYLAVSLE